MHADRGLQQRQKEMAGLALMAHTGILKGFRILVHYRDGSRYGTTKSTQSEVQFHLDSINLTEVYTVNIAPVWSQPGEVVELEVHSFPPAGD